MVLVPRTRKLDHNPPSSSAMGGGRGRMKRPSALVYVAVLAGFVLLAISGATWYVLARNHSATNTVNCCRVVTKRRSIQGFQSPNKTEAQINEVYDTGSITLQVMLGTSTFDGNTLTSAGYHIRYTSESLQPVTVAGPALNVGCIATGNRSYKDDPSIFNAGRGSTALSVLRSQNATLSPYGSTEVDIVIPNNCQYIGTADGTYWWPMEELAL